VKFTPDGEHVLVPQNESRNLAVFDAAARKLIANIPLSASPKVMAIAPDGRRAVITSPEADLAIVVDLVARKEVSAFPTGKRPDGVAWAAAPKRR
jgi:DNA-binding beta-propeller fold protein YncE